MGRISTIGIFTGVVTIMAGNYLAGLFLRSAVFRGMLSTGPDAQKIEEASLTLMAQEDKFLLASFIMSLLLSVFGGYIAATIARVARKGIFLNSGLVGLVIMFYGVLSPVEIESVSDFSGFVEIAPFILAVPAALLGGILARSYVKNENA